MSQVPLAFKKLVYDELLEADKRARELIKSIPPKVVYKARKITHGQIAYRKEVCKTCGVPWDENNPDCATCYKRHETRRGLARKKAKND